MRPSIFQNVIPSEQLDVAALRLPGMRPVGDRPWITVDDAYAAQMAERRALMTDHRRLVCDVLPEAQDRFDELLDHCLHQMDKHDRFEVGDGQVVRPDGAVIAIDRSDPCLTLATLLQEDLCLLEKQGDEHVLTGAVLCFPSNWTLDEKIGRPLMRIHKPIPEYDQGVGKRVQRLFDGVQPGMPIWRANSVVHDAPDLFQPKREAEVKAYSTNGRYLRSERQTVLRLPKTRAVLFAIHTSVVPLTD